MPSLPPRHCCRSPPPLSVVGMCVFVRVRVVGWLSVCTCLLSVCLLASYLLLLTSYLLFLTSYFLLLTSYFRCLLPYSLAYLPSYLLVCRPLFAYLLAYLQASLLVYLPTYLPCSSALGGWGSGGWDGRWGGVVPDQCVCVRRGGRTDDALIVETGGAAPFHHP